MHRTGRDDEAGRIRAGAAALGVALDPDAVAALSRLLDELEHWNKAFNLTAVRERGQMVTHHLLDSLAVVQDLRGPRILDVGTGAGFPGLPLAIARPELDFTLLDSAGKKIRFVEHAVRTLRLGNVTAVHARVPDYAPSLRFDSVLGRAFAKASRFAADCEYLLAPHGRLLMMKGRQQPDEWAGLDGAWSVAIRPLAVPELHEQRHLLTLTLRDEES